MSTLRYGKIERAIAAEIARDTRINRSGEKGSVLIRSDSLITELYAPPDPVWGKGVRDGNWKPAPAQRKAVTRAMHSFVRKHQQYALTGGQGRRQLYLYDTADPVSVMWAKLYVERRHRNFISRSDARVALQRLSTEASASG
jgi:hypothetical protein